MASFNPVDLSSWSGRRMDLKAASILYSKVFVLIREKLPWANYL